MSVVTIAFYIFIVGDVVWCWNACLAARRFPQTLQTVARIGAIAFTAMQMAGFFLMVFSRQLDLPLESFFPKPAIAAVYIWHCLILLPTAFLWFLTKVVASLLWIARKLMALSRSKPLTNSPAEQAGAGMTRRDFITAAACATPAILTLGVTGAAAIQWNEFRVRRLNVPIPNLPAPLDGLTIAQVSDLHVGVFTRGAILDRIVEASNRLEPDLVLLPGDLINYSLRDLPVGLEVVKRLQARFGVFMCEGNHDLFEDPTGFRQGTAEAGVRLLVNESATIPIGGVPLQILGLRWGWGGGDPHARSNRSDTAIAAAMKELMPHRNAEAFPILLAHHPHAFDYAEDIPLVLSGHTHGGQLMLTEEIGFGPALFRYWSGLYQKSGRALVVSNGVGNWFPLRVQAPAEIVHITLRSA
jgi:predicted MPP superfamily phosphohydrolase